MPTLIDNLNLINSYKSDIKSAIEGKGVDMTGVSFPGYAGKIGEIETSPTLETLSVYDNGTYTPTGGVDGYNRVIVDVPQQGYTQKDLTEATYDIQNLNNAASYVASSAFNAKPVSTVNLPNCSVVYHQAFRGCTSLSQVSLPICQEIYQSAFYNCTALTSLNLPQCSVVMLSAFAYCYSLSQVSLPVCKSIDASAFAGCSVLSDLSLPQCEYVGIAAFDNCSSLSQVDLPACISIQAQAFYRCSWLNDISLPVCTYIGMSAFYSCSRLSRIILPECSIVDTSAFGTGYSLAYVSLPECLSMGGLVFVSAIFTEIDLPKLFYISGAAFNLCQNLTTVSLPCLTSASQWYGNGAFLGTNLSQLYIGTDTYSIVSYSRLFRNANIPLTNGTGSIYVNVNNYNAYATADGWSSISSLLVSVGDDTEPLLSYDTNTSFLYGSTRTIESTWSTYLNVTVNSVTDVSLPNCIAVLPQTFKYYGYLNKVYFGSCKYIGYNAFERCTVSEIYLPSTTFCYIDNNTFYSISNNNYVVYVNKNLVSKYKTAQYWSNISSRIYPIISDFEFDDGLVWGNATSMDSTYLTTLGISADDVISVSMGKLTDLASGTFMNHQNLVSVDIPLVSEYGDNLFNGCTSLSEYVIDYNSGVITLGTGVFDNCTALTTIYVPYGMLSDYQSAQGWSDYSSLMIESVPELAFNDGLVFGSASSLSYLYQDTLGINRDAVISVNLPQCTFIGKSTFHEHHGLKDLSLPEVTYIDTNAFFGANYINDLVLPKCSYIGVNAFSWTGLGNFRNLTLGYSGIVSTGGDIQLSNNITHIYVPSSLVSAYKVDNNYWIRFATKIYPIPE